MHRSLICTLALFTVAAPSPTFAFQTDDAPPLFRTSREMVVLRATVTDPLNRYVIGLEREHFRIFDDKIEQQIAYFANDKSPISVGFILDISGSMGDNLISARNSIIRFLEQGDPEDEYFLVTFNERTAIVQDFTPRGENIQSEVAFTDAKGRTALFDAIYLGLEKAKEGRHDKKALIVITDGEDNSSRYTFSEIKEFAKESDAQIYVIGEKGEIGYGRGVIGEIVRLTGGRPFFPNNLKQLDYFCDLIHTELRNQYVVGFTPSTKADQGKWRKLKVQLDPPEGLPKLKIRHRQGYFPRKN